MLLCIRARFVAVDACANGRVRGGRRRRAVSGQAQACRLRGGRRRSRRSVCERAERRRRRRFGRILGAGCVGLPQVLRRYRVRRFASDAPSAPARAGCSGLFRTRRRGPGAPARFACVGGALRRRAASHEPPSVLGGGLSSKLGSRCVSPGPFAHDRHRCFHFDTFSAARCHVCAPSRRMCAESAVGRGGDGCGHGGRGVPHPRIGVGCGAWGAGAWGGSSETVFARR